MRHCIECGNPTGLKLVALPVCPDCYVGETLEEHHEHIARENAQLEHPSGKSARRRAAERWDQPEFLGRSGP